MPLLVPGQEDYKSASEQVIGGIQGLSEKVDWCIYGSFVTGKVRPGLSDIDAFLLMQDNGILFPGKISQEFSRTKSDIVDLGIPLQVTYVTTGVLENRFASPDYFYLQEVKRGIEMGYSSRDFSNKFIENRVGSIDDLGMARYFLKKASNIPANLHRVSEIILKAETDITSEDQKDLQKFWDTFKKMLSFCTLSVRILKGESVFDQSDTEIFNKFYAEVGEIPDIDRFLEILGKIQSIEDWYKYLKEEQGLEEIMNIYNTVFQDIAKKVSEKFSNLY